MIKRIMGKDFWEILERIIGKISSIIGAGLIAIAICATMQNFVCGYR